LLDIVIAKTLTRQVLHKLLIVRVAAAFFSDNFLQFIIVASA
jgi:hypothetical protein